MMKRGLILLLVGLMLLSFGSFVCADCPENVVAYYNFNNDAKDFSGVYDGTISGTLNTVEGLLGNALDFSETQSYAILPNGVLNGKQKFSVSMWLKTPGSNDGIFSVSNSQTNNELTFFKQNYFTLFVDGSQKNFGGVFNNDNWHHLVVIVDSGVGRVYVYLDGQVMKSGGYTYRSITRNTISAGEIMVGDSKSHEDYEGLIDELSVFDKVLSASDVTALYNGGSPEPICTASVECTEDSECGQEIYSDNYCDNIIKNKIVKNHTTYSCTEGSCVTSIVKELVEECDDLCVSGVCSAATWTDMMDSAITNADLNDMVKLVVNLEGLEDGEINFTIRKKLGGDWFDWLIPDKIITNEAKTTWRASESGTFYFIASVDRTKVESGELDVSSSVDNSNPIITIVNPTDSARKFENGSEIDFNISVSDVDDDVKVVWDFGDGSSETKSNCLINKTCNTTHSYSGAGVKDVSVVVEEIGRDNKAIDCMQLNIFENGLNLMGIISEPYFCKIGEWVFRGPDERLISFDGSESFVANCGSTCGSDNPDGCYDVEGLKCFNQDSNIKLHWGFSDGDNRQGEWSDELVSFEKEFVKFGPQNVSLKVGFNDVWGSSFDISFIFADIGPYCDPDYNGEKWANWGEDDWDLVSTEDDCYREDGWDDDGDRQSCCPSREFCDSSGKCVRKQVEVSVCEDYDDENFASRAKAKEACLADSYNVGIYTVEETIKLPGFCVSRVPINVLETCRYFISNCRCEWEDNKCIPSYDEVSDCDDAGTCKYEIVGTPEDKCDTEGVMIYTRSAVFSDTANPTGYFGECVDDVVSADCGRPVVRLPFFGWFNFVLVGLVLGGFYFLNKKCNLYKI